MFLLPGLVISLYVIGELVRNFPTRRAPPVPDCAYSSFPEGRVTGCPDCSDRWPVPVGQAIVQYT